jgi:ADP-ribose pyrophosphatase YjhB (NUDIX family)
VKDIMPEYKWTDWAQRIQAIAQSGLHHTQNEFEKLRYKELIGIAAEIYANNANIPLDSVQIEYEKQSGYATPKLDVRGVIFTESKILLVRELMDGGKWTLPGGWIDVGESPRQAVERELREEAGVIAKAKKVLAIYDRNLHGHPPYFFHIYKIFILCELIAEATPDPLETSDPTFFSLGNLPELSTARVTVEEIKRMFDYLHNPNLPTDFD